MLQFFIALCYTLGLQKTRGYYASINYTPTYLFDNEKGSFLVFSAGDKHIRKICKMVGIKEKSAHKSRKTCASRLLDGDIPINYVREQVGHKDDKTTLNYDGYSSIRDEEILKKTVDILSTRKSTA